MDSEVGRLRTVLLHRPGAELRRLTPAQQRRLLFDGIPWVERAQDEHDAFADALRERGVEVLYLSDLLPRRSPSAEAREQAARRRAAPQADRRRRWRRAREHLAHLRRRRAGQVLMAGLAHERARRSPRRARSHALTAAEDFVVDPLPNLLFTRDSAPGSATGSR